MLGNIKKLDNIVEKKLILQKTRAKGIDNGMIDEED